METVFEANEESKWLTRNLMEFKV